MELVQDNTGKVDHLLEKIQILEQEKEGLKKRVTGLNDLIKRKDREQKQFIENLATNFQVYDGKTIQPHVVEWMIEYGMPWEVFWCENHNQWHTELDSNFPYHMSNNECEWCKKGR